MSAIMLQNGQKMAKMLHNAAKKFDWDGNILLTTSSLLCHAKAEQFSFVELNKE